MPMSCAAAAWVSFLLEGVDHVNRFSDRDRIDRAVGSASAAYNCRVRTDSRAIGSDSQKACIFHRRRLPANRENKAMYTPCNSCGQNRGRTRPCSGFGMWLALVYGGGNVMKTKTNVKAGTASDTPREVIVLTFSKVQFGY